VYFDCARRISTCRQTQAHLGAQIARNTRVGQKCRVPKPPWRLHPARVGRDELQRPAPVVSSRLFDSSMSDRSDRLCQMNEAPAVHTPGSAAEVFRVALKLGLTSFGGPIAHLGYFERTYVRQRRWLSESEYAGLIGLCQLLPGPSSSQVGFLIGYHRAGWLGALAAWAAFTLPSALLMYAFAMLAARLQGPMMQAVVHGLMLTAVAVVAQALWSMARSLCPDRQRAAIALLGAVLLLLHGSAPMQIAVICLGAVGGWLLCRSVRLPEFTPPAGLNTGTAWIIVTVFCVLLVALPALALLNPHGAVGLANIFYRAGALVFGGGHVVLPLLRDALVPSGWISDKDFLTGYGFAQGMPGPLFTFAAYLGAVSAPARASAVWAIVALAAIFLPGLLLAIAGMSLWNRLGQVPTAPAMLAGINAAVVGVLGAAFYDPVWSTGIRGSGDVAVAVTGFLLLQRWRVQPILVVALCVVVSVATMAFT
jgi:chromate transporter